MYVNGSKCSVGTVSYPTKGQAGRVRMLFGAPVSSLYPEATPQLTPTANWQLGPVYMFDDAPTTYVIHHHTAQSSRLLTV